MYRLVILHFFETYFRHRWLFLIPIILGVLSGVVYVTKVMNANYVSQSVLLVNNGQTLLSALSSVNDANSSIFFTAAQTSADEINQLIKTDSFIRAIIKQTDLETKMTGSPEDVDQLFIDTRKEIKVAIIGNKQVQVVVTDKKPVVAYQLVSAITNIYIQWKLNSQIIESQTALDFFTNLIAQYKSVLDKCHADLNTYVAAHPAPVRGERTFSEQSEIDRLNGDIKIAQDRYTSAMEKQENAQLSLQQIESNIHQTYVVMDAPKITAKPSTSLPKTAAFLGIFLGVGILLSIILIAGSYLFDTTIRFSLDVTSHVNLPVLAIVPDTSPQEPPLVQRLLRSTRKVKLISNIAEEKILSSSTNAEGEENA